MSETPEARALALAALIYRAASHPTGWVLFTLRLSESLGGPKIGMNLELPDDPSERFVLPNEKDGYSRVFADYAARHELPWPLDKLVHRREFVWGAELFPDERLEQTGFYRDYMEPQGLLPVGALGNVFGHDGHRPLGAIGIYRRIGGREFDASDIAMLNLLVPHLESAYEIHCSLVASRRREDAMAEVMDRFPTGVFLLNADLAVVGCNRAATRIAAAQDGFSIEHGVPVATELADAKAFAELLERGVRGRNDPELARSGLTLARPSGQRSYQVFVMRLLAAPETGRSGDAVAVVFISDPDDQHLRMPDLLASLYQLTDAEAELAVLLSQGESVESAAVLRGVSPHTARSQLKRIFAKTQVSRQSELVRLLLTSVTALEGDKDEGETDDGDS